MAPRLRYPHQYKASAGKKSRAPAISAVMRTPTGRCSGSGFQSSQPIAKYISSNAYPNRQVQRQWLPEQPADSEIYDREEDKDRKAQVPGANSNRPTLGAALRTAKAVQRKDQDRQSGSTPQAIEPEFERF